MQERKKILLAEDSAFFRTMFGDALRKEGFEVETAVDGIEALSKLNSPDCRYNLFLLDLQMPNMSGTELLKKIKNEGSAIKIPTTLILTGTTPSSSQLSELRQLGVKGYIVKSQSEKDIIFRIKSSLDSKENIKKDKKELISIPVQYSKGNRFVNVSTFDFTQKGLYIATTNPVPVGDILQLKFNIPTANKSVVLNGKVMFNIKLGSQKTGSYPPGMGIHFMNLSDNLKQILADFVNSSQDRSATS